MTWLHDAGLSRTSARSEKQVSARYLAAKVIREGM